MNELEATTINFSKMTVDLLNLVTALDIAVKQDFMAREHAGLIWKKWLATSQLDVSKVKVAFKQEATT